MMIGKTNNNKRFTGAQLRRAAAKELYSEMESLKKRPLNKVEKTKMDKLALLLTQQVLNEMEGRTLND